MGQWVDNGDFSYSNDRVGIGFATNPSPAMYLSVNGPSYINGAIFTSRIAAYSPTNRFDFGWGATAGSNLEFYSNDHTTSPGQMRFVFGKANTGNVNYLSYDASTGWTSRLFVNYDGNIGIGTQSPTSKLDVQGEIKAHSLSINGDLTGNTLAINGKITAKEVEVTLDGWPDYVFSEDYTLSPLSDVEEFIKQNKHLPGVPTEKEINEEGLSLGQMNKLMMEKIEELTLYIIDLEKKINKLEAAE